MLFCLLLFFVHKAKSAREQDFIRHRLVFTLRTDRLKPLMSVLGTSSITSPKHWTCRICNLASGLQLSYQDAQASGHTVGGTGAVYSKSLYSKGLQTECISISAHSQLHETPPQTVLNAVPGKPASQQLLFQRQG